MTFTAGIYALPPGAPFAKSFAEGFHARFSTLDPVQISEIQILVNTSLARQTIEHALADAAKSPGVLPRLVMMSEFHADALRMPDLPTSVAPGRRRLRLTRLVEQFLAATDASGADFAPAAMAVELADALALLIDQFHDEGIDPGGLDALLEAGGLTEEAAQHWATTLRFVDIVRRAWPQIMAEEEGGALDARARQRAAIAHQLDAWQANPPQGPVIAVASTGSVGSTADLMAGVARLPQGAVVLPGLDPATPADIWEHAGPDHPLGPFRRFFELMEKTPNDAVLWHGSSAGDRAQLVAQALRPAPVTDHWHREAAALATLVPQAAAGLSLLEAASPQEEATAIAFAIRDALETPERTVTLITPDANLARRVTAALQRFKVVPDDTMGQPLLQSPPGVLFRMVAELAVSGIDAVGLSALLHHPLVQPGIARGLHLGHVRTYERAALRNEMRVGSDLPPWDGASEAQQEWLGRLAKALDVLGAELRANAPLSGLLGAHRSVLEALTQPGEDAPAAIWTGDAGETLDSALAALAQAADAYGEGPVTDYPTLVQLLLKGEQIRPKPRESHPRVAISGPREARLISADLVILAGLEDGTWPALPDPGPWLSRPMRIAIGLPLPERSVGLSAHDFLHAACGPDVILSRARKRDGAATVASRWLIRLETLVRGVGTGDVWDQMQARGARWCAEARQASLPRLSVPRAERPKPNPPLSARPRKLSVTGIELLVRDAYAIYARDILRLRPLEPLGRAPDARDRGTLLHMVLERFVAQTDPWPGEAQALHQLLQIADDCLAAEVPAPDLRRTWRARLGRAAKWFVAEEAIRRRHGRPAALERRGSLMLDLPGGPFEITAKADRIDRTEAKEGIVIDYKTGEPPTLPQITGGFSQQLHVQAAILAAGGFEGVTALQPATGLYLGLTGSGAGGKETRVDDLLEQTPRHLKQLEELLAAYDRGAPYLARGRPQFTHYKGDYDHLARVAEWLDEDAS